MVNPSGTRIGNTLTLVLGAYEPYLRRVDDVMNTGNFPNGTLRISVSAGSAPRAGIGCASRSKIASSSACTARPPT